MMNNITNKLPKNILENFDRTILFFYFILFPLHSLLPGFSFWIIKASFPVSAQNGDRRRGRGHGMSLLCFLYRGRRLHHVDVGDRDADNNNNHNNNIILNDDDGRSKIEKRRDDFDAVGHARGRNAGLHVRHRRRQRRQPRLSVPPISSTSSSSSRDSFSSFANEKVQQIEE